MKILRNLLIGLLGVISGLALTSFLLPQTAHFERKTVINATPDVVFVQVNTLNNWEKWSPWHRIDPNMKLTYAPQTTGTGAWYSWTSENSNVGNGKLTITQSHANRHIATAMDFGGSEATANYHFRLVAGGTEVVWDFNSDAGNNPFMRFMGLMMESFVGKDYEKGLANLKGLCEGNKQSAKL